MAEPALAAIYRAVRQRLTASAELWGQQVYPDQAPGGVERPYVVYFWSGGGELNAIVGQDAEIVLTVKVVADSLAQAFTGAGRISALLNDADGASASPLNGGTDWTIIHVQQEQVVHLVETVNTTQIYHEGARFRFYAEAV